FLAFCISFFSVPAANANIDLAYQPMRVDLRLVPGQVQTGTIQLKNDGRVPMHLRARMLDFYVSSNNTPQFSTVTDESYSCRKWTILNPTEVDIAPESILTF